MPLGISSWLTSSIICLVVTGLVIIISALKGAKGTILIEAVFGKTVVNNRRVIIVIVTKDINKGEEILSDYGDSYWDYINEND